MKRTISICFCLIMLYCCKKEEDLQTSVELTSLTHSGNTVTVSWSATNAAAIQTYSVQRSTNSTAFTAIYTVISGEGNTYSHPAPPAGTYYYRIMATTADSSYYSNTRRIVI